MVIKKAGTTKKPGAEIVPPPKPPSAVIVALDGLLGSQAPIQIPGKIKFLMAKFGHWLVIGLMVLVLPGQLLALGWRAGMLPFASLGGTDSTLQVAFALATLLFLIVMLIMALPGLQGRKVIGWQLLMLCNVINMIYGLLNGGIVGPILGMIIGLYVLFQVRRYYF